MNTYKGNYVKNYNSIVNLKANFSYKARRYKHPRGEGYSHSTSDTGQGANTDKPTGDARPQTCTFFSYAGHDLQYSVAQKQYSGFSLIHGCESGSLLRYSVLEFLAPGLLLGQFYISMVVILEVLSLTQTLLAISIIL